MPEIFKIPECWKTQNSAIKKPRKKWKSGSGYLSFSNSLSLPQPSWTLKKQSLFNQRHKLLLNAVIRNVWKEEEERDLPASGALELKPPENNKIHLSFLIHAELATPYCAASLLQFKKYIFIPIVLYFYFVYQCYTKETIQMIESIDDTVSTCCTG